MDKLDGLIGRQRAQATTTASPSGKAKFVRKETRRDTISDTIRLVDQIKDRKRRNSRAAFQQGMKRGFMQQVADGLLQSTEHLSFPELSQKRDEKSLDEIFSRVEK